MSTSQKYDQNKGVTIAIGLGGTGVACLRNLKQRIYTSLKPDDPDSVIPAYDSIKFLAVDTDKSSLAPTKNIWDLDESTEFFDISCSNIQALLANTKILAGRPECKWLKTQDEETGQKGLSILSATAGAGGVPQIGRLLIIQKASEFVQKVSSLIMAAEQSLGTNYQNCDINVHVLSGMGGGTGAGIFLDVCYLVQEALQQTGRNGRAITCGYFFMPDVNLSIPAVASDPPTAKFVKVNGFASMKELDYCMNFANNHGQWDQIYPGFRITTRKPPVDLCHLISSQTISGMSVKNGFSYAMNVVADYVMQFLVETTAFTSKDTKFTLRSHISNYHNCVSAIPKTAGANYSYCLLGASNATIPMREITTYLGSKLFESMSSIKNHCPSDTAVETFAEENGLTFKKLFHSLMDGTSYQVPVLDLDYKIYEEMSENDLSDTQIVIPAPIGDAYRNMEQKIIGRVEANKQALLHEWLPANIQTERGSISKMCQVYYSLSDVICDPDRGPVYASCMLKGSNNKNLIDILRGVCDAASNYLHEVEGDTELRIREIKEARTNFLHPKLLQNRSKLFSVYLQSVQQLETTENEITVLEKMIEMLRNMIEQFKNLYNRYFQVYAQVTLNLMDTFHANYMQLCSDQEPQDNPFTKPLMTIKDLQSSLDKTIAAMKLGSEFTSFQSMLFPQTDVWGSNDEHKISKCVSNYLTDKFSAYTQKTLEDYLELYFKTQTPAILIDQTRNNIMLPLNNCATPMFWMSPNFSTASASRMGYCSVPVNSSVVSAAAQKLQETFSEINPVYNTISDQISILQCLCGIPMFSYNGISNYSAEYSSSSFVGKHLYEKTEADPRDWRMLPNLIPYSINTNPSDSQQEAEALYDQAVSQKIIYSSNGTDYHILIYPEIDDIKASVQASLAASSINEIQQGQQDISSYLSSRAPVRKIFIPNDGAAGHEDKVRKDHVLASAELIEIIRTEVEKKSALTDLQQKLEEASKNLIQTNSLKNQFFEAMMTGVFVYNIPKVSYTQEVFGITNTIELSNPKMAPYGGAVPLYQAYLSYSQMSSKDQDDIASLAGDRMNRIDPALKESCFHLKNVFTDQYMGTQQQMLMIKETDGNKIRTVLNFLMDFRKGLSAFMDMYQLNN